MPEEVQIYTSEINFIHGWFDIGQLMIVFSIMKEKRMRRLDTNDPILFFHNIHSVRVLKKD